jgi:hypothetical protein
MVLLLAAVALNKTAYGLLLVRAFSVGLATAFVLLDRSSSVLLVTPRRLLHIHAVAFRLVDSGLADISEQKIHDSH